MAYAQDTSVPVERSKAEIEKLLVQHGASQYNSGWNSEYAYISFDLRNLKIAFKLPLPSRDDKKFTHFKRSQWSSEEKRSDTEAVKRWEQACRARWRALCLVIKAKLEAVEIGIATFEEEFLAHIIIPGTENMIGEMLIPQIQAAYRGEIKLLPMMESKQTK